MPQEIKIPPLGESITEVTIANFLKNEGDFVKQEEEILELETEKVNQVLYAPYSGTIHWKHKIGDRLRIGEIVGVIQEGGTPPKKEEKKESVKKESTTSPSRLTKEEGIQELLKPKNASSHREAKDSDEERIKMSALRRTLAKKLVEVKLETAMLTTFNEVDLTRVIDIREKQKENFQKKYHVKLGFLSFFLKAVVSALKEFPIVNAHIEEEEVVFKKHLNIGVAVSTERGLLVPVLKSVENMTMWEMEKKIDELATKARDKKIEISDLEGGTFTISNGGVFGSLLSTPIMTPGQTAILGMHKIQKRAVVIEDKIEIRSMMYLALSYDHRLIDGKEAVSFLVHIKKYLEEFQEGDL